MNRRTQTVVEIGSMAVVVVVAVALVYSLWLAGRWVSYTFAYETSVKRTVCEMVKTEYLKNPGECIK